MESTNIRVSQFVVDGNWVTDHTAPQENDASGNLNNVLTTDRVTKHTPATAGIMSTVTPSSTTAGLAKDVPLEKDKAASDLPGTFPETPSAVERDEVSVNPLPAAEGAVNPIKLAPGEKVPDPSTFTSNTITSGVHDDPVLVAADKKAEGEQMVGVSPLPAFPGAVNPVTLAPGEKVPDPSTLTGNTITSAVHTDKASYENSGAFGITPVIPPAASSQSEQNAKGAGGLDLPPISKNMIPESSLPMGTSGAGTFNANPTIQSAGPQSTTAQLAGQVSLESSKVPSVVKESQQEAGVSPEASAIPAEVKDKAGVEEEELKEVPVAPSTSEGTSGSGTDKSERGMSMGGIAATAGGAAAAAAKSSGVASKLPESVQKSIDDMNVKSTEHTAAKDTPGVVTDSIAKSGRNPEATTNEEAVLEKKAVEDELRNKVQPVEAKGEPATQIATSGLNAPANPTPIDSRDVSPHTKTSTETGPTVTSGVASTTTDKATAALPTTPGKDTTTSAPASSSKTNDTPASSSKATESPASNTTAEKKKKRTSIFGKLKAKFSDKK